jgi:hypothetical protein
MKLRRKNKFLETLLNKYDIPHVAFSTSRNDIKSNINQMQIGGDGDVFDNLIKQVNIFTNKWNKKNSTTFECNNTKIEKPNVKLTIDTSVESYLNT